MKSTGVARVWACLLIGTISGYLVHLDYLRWAKRGREAFLAAQNQRFDLTMATPKPALTTIIAFVILVGLVIGLYEVIASLLSRFLGSSGMETDANGGPYIQQPR